MKKAAKIINIITILFAILFFVYSAIIGGDAITGFDAPVAASDFTAGEYYVASHGLYTHVSYGQWLFSFIITIALFMSFIAAVVINIIAMFKKSSEQCIA